VLCHWSICKHSFETKPTYLDEDWNIIGTGSIEPRYIYQDSREEIVSNLKVTTNGNTDIEVTLQTINSRTSMKMDIERNIKPLLLNLTDENFYSKGVCNPNDYLKYSYHHHLDYRQMKPYNKKSNADYVAAALAFANQNQTQKKKRRNKAAHRLNSRHFKAVLG
jgi:hypothetical protein